MKRDEKTKLSQHKMLAQQTSKTGRKRNSAELGKGDTIQHKKQRENEKVDIVPSTSSKRLTKSEENRIYYERNKDKIKEARMKSRKAELNHKAELAALEEKDSGNSDIVQHTGGKKLTKSERNKLYYEKNKERIKEARKKDYKDAVKRETKLKAMRESYKEPRKHAAVLARKKLEYSAKVASLKLTYRNPLKRKAKLEAMRKSYKDPVRRASVLVRRKQAYAVPEKRAAKVLARKKSQGDAVKHAVELANRRKLYKKCGVTRKNKSDSDYDFLLRKARQAMLEMPILACTVCHRARFKEQVKLCDRRKYPQSETVLRCFTGKYVHQCSTDCNDSSVYHDKKKKEWICFIGIYSKETCHPKLLSTTYGWMTYRRN